MLVLLDEFPLQRFEMLLDGLPVAWIDRAERALDVCWSRQVAMRAATLYAEGQVAQMRLPAGDRAAHRAAYRETLDRLQSEVEAQMTEQGYYVPFAPVRMVVAQKLGTGRKDVDDGTDNRTSEQGVQGCGVGAARVQPDVGARRAGPGRTEWGGEIDADAHPGHRDPID
jgi:hypothetical protein